MTIKKVNPPLVYSCSGCSSAAQAANSLAIRLDRAGEAEMSCIVGVAAGVPSLVRVAKSGRPMLVIDGCPLACSVHAFRNQGLAPDEQIDLSRHGVKKRLHEDAPAEQLDQLWEDIVLPAARRLALVLATEDPGDSKGA
jgi:uncharacterized metal-binding protein